MGIVFTARFDCEVAGAVPVPEPDAPPDKPVGRLTGLAVVTDVAPVVGAVIMETEVLEPGAGVVGVPASGPHCLFCSWIASCCSSAVHFS